MQLCRYHVGQVLPNFKTCQDGVYVDFTDVGISIIVLCNKPSSKEIQQYSDSSNAQVKVIHHMGVIFFLMKFGNLPWMDAPYNVNASLNATLSDVPHYIRDVTKGYVIHLMVVDTATGTIVKMRTFALDHAESNKLCTYMRKQAKDDSPAIFFDLWLDTIYSNLRTEDLLSLWEENNAKL